MGKTTKQLLSSQSHLLRRACIIYYIVYWQENTCMYVYMYIHLFCRLMCYRCYATTLKSQAPKTKAVVDKALPRTGPQQGSAELRKLHLEHQALVPSMAYGKSKSIVKYRGKRIDFVWFCSIQFTVCSITIIYNT